MSSETDPSTKEIVCEASESVNDESIGSMQESPRERARWNRLATSMEYFHNYFKSEFDKLYELADGSFSKQHMSLPMYLREADELKRHLEMHHTIEERFIFPILAKRMPSFAEDEQHRNSHHGIHEGLDRLSQLTHDIRAEPSSYSPEKMRACLDSFRDVLMRHLDEEVADLQGDNLKRYWTLDEVERIAM